MPKFITEEELEKGIRKYEELEDVLDAFCRCDCGELLDVRGLLLHLSMEPSAEPTTSTLAGLSRVAVERCKCEYTPDELIESIAKWGTKFRLHGLANFLRDVGVSEEEITSLIEKIEDRVYVMKLAEVREKVGFGKRAPPGMYI